jgi:phage repressor protein C with HTH and peptisase S24 domain
MESKKPASIGSRIRERREELGISRAAFAKAIDYKNIAELEGSSKVKRPKKLKEISEALHSPQHWLLTGKGPRSLDEGELSAAAIISGGKGIGELDAPAGHGGGGTTESREVMVNGQYSDPLKDERWQFPSGFVREELRAPEHQLLVLEGLGDSMEPTIRSGDRSICHTGHKVPSPDGIYALRDRYGMIVIKRLQVLRKGDPPRIKIISDNPNHKDEEVGADEIEIVGRIIWVLKRL